MRFSDLGEVPDPPLSYYTEGRIAEILQEPVFDSNESLGQVVHWISALMREDLFLCFLLKGDVPFP